jgi:L-asparaginase
MWCLIGKKKPVTRIVVLSAGGTIASRCGAQHRSVVSNAGGGELVASLGSLAPDVAVVAEELSNIGSYSVDPATPFSLAQTIRTLLTHPGISGFAATHGTGTMEESVYRPDFLTGSAKLVVFTGVERHTDEPDVDGLRILADAIRTAATEDAIGPGVVIIFGEAFYTARDASAIHATRIGSFAWLEQGRLGGIDAGRVRIHHRTIRRNPIISSWIEPQVDDIKFVIGSGDRFVVAAVETGTRGMPVAVTSGSPQGRAEPIYGTFGGCDLANAGTVPSWDPSALKVRMLTVPLLGIGVE